MLELLVFRIRQQIYRTKTALGADLVQFYTGFVYKGPDLIGDCVKAIKDGANA